MILVQSPDGTEKCFVAANDLPFYDGWTVLGEGENARPIDGGEWNGSAWEVPLDTLKSRALARIGALKTHHEDAGIATPWGIAQSDQDSRGKINGIVGGALAAAQLGTSFSINFTMADNTTVALETANEVLRFGLAVLAGISHVHDRSRALKDAVELATTPEALAAIDFEGGWAIA